MQYEFKKTPSDHRSHYVINLEKALILALLFFTLLALFSPRFDVTPREKELPQIVIDVRNIPVTRQTHRTPPPPKPTVPVPSDDEAIPEDATIDETTLKYTNIYDLTDGLPALSGLSITPPKRITLAVPEMPKEDQKKGVQGIVKLSLQVDERGNVIEAVVIDNTTNSERCAQAAIEAAYGNRFSPAKEGGKPVKAWYSMTYEFNFDN